MTGPIQRADSRFQTTVFPDELEVIWRRRDSARKLSASLTGWPPPRRDDPAPSTQHDLMGLSLSGGGIRAASFSLGVLQRLSAVGLLSRVDYLSTVSGGGLIGASVSCLLNSPGVSADSGPAAPAGDDRFPLGFNCGEVERPAIQHLRSRSRWLAPGGGLDNIRLPAIILRGILNNFAVLLPLLMIAVLVTEQLFGIAYRVGLDRLHYAPIIGAAVFAVIALAQPLLYRIFSGRYLSSWSARDRYEHILSIALVLAIVILVLVPTFLLVQEAIDLDWNGVKIWYAENRIVVWGTAAAVALVVGTAGKFAFDAPGRLIGQVSVILVGLIGHVIVFGLYLVLTLIQVESPVLDYPGALDDLNQAQVTPALSEQLAAMDYSVTVGAPITPSGSVSYPRWSIPSETGAVLVTQWKDTVRVVNTLDWDGESDAVFLAFGVFGLLYAAFFSNANITSAHGFFRDRMSRAFLFAVKDGAIEYQDDLKLSALNRPGSTAPYHLLNVTLNLQGARDINLSGRDADFFVLANRYSGSPTTGYCETTALEEHDPHLNLATAIAISGAGLSPNSGTSTVKPLVYLTTLLNLRLDYWLASPRSVNSPSAVKRARRFASVGPIYLLKEAFGRLDGKGPFVNVSDGGHLENLGIYELLRRRCRWVIAVDASEDPTMSCACLMDVIRYARIDLGIIVAINIDQLRSIAGAAPTRSTAHFAVGTIDYGNGEYGQLVYLKSSMTGDEPDTIRQYREMHPTFPQESSSNQAFTESQFEAYRALGEHIITTVIAETVKGMPEGVQVDWPVELRA